jgi:hypothetical protein
MVLLKTVLENKINLLKALFYYQNVHLGDLCTPRISKISYLGNTCYVVNSIFMYCTVCNWTISKLDTSHLLQAVFQTFSSNT